jgi:hypothetical protein
MLLVRQTKMKIRLLFFKKTSVFPPKIDKNVIITLTTRVVRLLGITYQNRKIVPIDPKIFQMAVNIGVDFSLTILPRYEVVPVGVIS